MFSDLIKYCQATKVCPCSGLQFSRRRRRRRNFQFKWHHQWYPSGGLELFIETRGWFSCWCSCNKVWKHPFSGDNKTKHLTGTDYDINSCCCSCCALDQAKLSRVINRTFLSTLLVKEMHFDPFFQIVIYVYKHEFATATFLQREQPQSSRTNRQIVTTQRYQLL